MQETRRDTNLQADGHQPNRIPNSETQQAMDLQKQPEPFATAPALGSTDLRPSTSSQMSDSLGAAPSLSSLLRRSLLLHRKPILVWKRRKGAGREPAAWKEEKTEGQDENYEEANCGEAGPLRRP